MCRLGLWSVGSWFWPLICGLLTSIWCNSIWFATIYITLYHSVSTGLQSVNVFKVFHKGYLHEEVLVRSCKTNIMHLYKVCWDNWNPYFKHSNRIYTFTQNNLIEQWSQARVTEGVWCKLNVLINFHLHQLHINFKSNRCDISIQITTSFKKRQAQKV